MSENRFSLRDNIAIIAVLLVLVMTVLDGSIVNVALPLMCADFGISESASVWIVTIYQLVITMLLLPFSAIGEKYGFKRVFLVGVALFTVASFGCSEMGSFAGVLLARGLQGCGAACVMAVNIALTRIIYKPEFLARGLALNAMVVAVSTAAGPTLAGAIMDSLSWHWLFLINVPVGILTFILAIKLLPRRTDEHHKSPFDIFSAFLNAVTFGLIFYALGSFTHGGGWMAVGLLLCGIVSGLVYLRRQKGKTTPMFPIDLFRNRIYTLSVATSVSAFVALNSAMVDLPFMFLSDFGFEAVTTGLLMTPWPLSTMLAAPLAARIIEKHNPGTVAAVGMGMLALGLSLLIFLPENPSEWNIVWRMVLCGFGFGLFQTPNNLVMVKSTPERRTGAAGGMQSTARLVGQTFGATLVTLMFALVADSRAAERSVLMLGVFFAVGSAIFSLSRLAVGKHR